MEHRCPPAPAESVLTSDCERKSERNVHLVDSFREAPRRRPQLSPCGLHASSHGSGNTIIVGCVSFKMSARSDTSECHVHSAPTRSNGETFNWRKPAKSNAS